MDRIEIRKLNDFFEDCKKEGEIILKTNLGDNDYGYGCFWASGFKKDLIFIEEYQNHFTLSELENNVPDNDEGKRYIDDCVNILDCLEKFLNFWMSGTEGLKDIAVFSDSKEMFECFKKEEVSICILKK